MKAENIFIGRDGGDEVVVVLNPYQFDNEIRKSGPGGATVVTTVVDLRQVGRDQMTVTEKYLAGGCFMAMLPREVTLISDEQTFREIRAGMMAKSVAAAAELDAGRGRLSDIIGLFPEAVEKSELGGVARDADGNALEPMSKGADLFGPRVDRGVFNGKMLTKGAGADLVRLAYREHAEDPDTSAGDLKKAAAELNELVDRLEVRG